MLFEPQSTQRKKTHREHRGKYVVLTPSPTPRKYSHTKPQRTQRFFTV